MGEATGGSTGQPLVAKLRGRVGRNLLEARVLPDGLEFIGIGIQRDRPGHPSIADFRDGRDTVLDAALQQIQSPE